MRNLKEYPITAEEVRTFLEHSLKVPDDVREVRIGDINGLIARAILNTLDIQLDKDMTVMDLVLEEADPFNQYMVASQKLDPL